MGHARSSRISQRLSRRAVLSRAGAMAAAAAVSSATPLAVLARTRQTGRPEPPSGGWIDAHVHVWTPDVARYPLAEGYQAADMQPPSFTPQELMRHAAPVGVGRVVLIQMSFYGFDNRYMLDVIRDQPATFRGVAVIDAQSENPAAEMRRLIPLGVRGYRIDLRDRQADEVFALPGMRAMWECGAREGLAMCCLTNPASLAAIDQMCDRFPQTPVVIDHFGRVGIDGTIRPADLDALCRLARHRQTAVKVSAFYALGRKQPPYLELVPMIRRLLDTFGPSRLMWASDCPFQVTAHRYSDSIELVRDRLDFLSAGDRAQMLAGTAARLYFR